MQNLPDAMQPVLDSKAQELRSRAEYVEGMLQSIHAILADWSEPIRKGNGDSGYRYHVTAGQPVHLAQIMGEAFADAFPAGKVSYLSLEPDSATVDALGHVAISKNGAIPLIIYNHEAVVRVFLVSSSR